MSIPQAARELKKANATILSLALRGELESELVAGRTVITRESIARYKERNAAK